MPQRILSRIVLIVLTLAGNAPAAHADFRPQWECIGLMLQQSGPASAEVGSTVRYSIRITNESGCAVTDALLEDFVPRKTIYLGAWPEPSFHPGTESPPGTALDQPIPLPVEKVQWRDVHLSPAEVLSEYEVVIQVEGPALRTMSNTSCMEHPRFGRICDTVDTFVKPAR